MEPSLPHDKPDAEALSLAMSEIDGVLKRGIQLAIPHLPPLRLKVMKALNAYIKDLERYCTKLELGSSDDRAMSFIIRSDVVILMKVVSDHVARWTPNAIAADANGYEIASDNLQKNIKAILKHSAI